MLLALRQIPLCSPYPVSLNDGKETAHRRLSEGCLEPIRAVIVADPTEEVPVAYPLGRLWRTCSYNLAVLEAAQLPASQSS